MIHVFSVSSCCLNLCILLLKVIEIRQKDCKTEPRVVYAMCPITNPREKTKEKKIFLNSKIPSIPVTAPG